MRNALDILQAAFLVGLPTADDIASGRVPVPSSPDVVIIVRKNGENVAAGPFPTRDVEWHRLPKDARIASGDGD